MKKTLLISFTLLLCALANAQTGNPATEGQQKQRKSTEIGLGIDIHNLSRVGLQKYSSSAEGDRYNLRIRDVMAGGNIYVARELNPWFYLDVQGTLGFTKALNDDGTEGKNKLFAMVGPGIQLRLTPLFNSSYVEPYFRVGANYYYKDFLVVRSGRLENFQGDYLQWTHTDEFNESVDNRNHFFPFSFGFGLNSWFNDHIGFGIQADYLTSFDSEKLNFPRVTARLMLRFGGSKARAESRPTIQIVEKVVTKEVPVEKIVEKEVIVEKTCEPLFKLFSNIYFDFDKSTIMESSNEALELAARILKNMAGSKFLITGFTDTKGSDEYNLDLSKRRAEAVVKALEERGVPAGMLKSRGVGKRAASLQPSESVTAREGDRKVTIEWIRNMEYWDRLGM